MCDGYKNSVKTQNLCYIQNSIYRGQITEQPKGDGKADISYNTVNCICVQNGPIQILKKRTKKNYNRDEGRHAFFVCLVKRWFDDNKSLMSNSKQNY